jgi:hypothetical protein
MNKSLILSGVLISGIGSAIVLAPRSSTAQTNEAVNSQQEFTAVFNDQSDAAALNQAGHAFDNQHSRLYWFTDLEAAKRQAKAEGKPIVSLRLLGKLSDEYSCANSRFFRVLLYPNRQINPLLRDKFVLHWSSERAVPVLTIDFGDGRKIKQTITGNSAHYLLDETGRPLDVLPGLYSPAAFESWLKNGLELTSNWKNEPKETRPDLLRAWHVARISAIWGETKAVGDKAKWIKEQTERSLKFSPLVSTKSAEVSTVVPASLAAARVFSKTAVEAPILDATTLFATSPRVMAWSWSEINLGPIALDEETKARIKAMNPRLETGQTKTRTRSFVQSIRFVENGTPVPPPVAPFDALLHKLETNIAADTASNKFEMEIPIHALFAQGKEGDFESLNRTIYDKLFLTPKSDPYLGLGSDGVFTGLNNGGIVEPKAN